MWQQTPRYQRCNVFSNSPYYAENLIIKCFFTFSYKKLKILLVPTVYYSTYLYVVCDLSMSQIVYQSVLLNPDIV